VQAHDQIQFQLQKPGQRGTVVFVVVVVIVGAAVVVVAATALVN
jgi:hypothetical protein